MSYKLSLFITALLFTLNLSVSAKIAKVNDTTGTNPFTIAKKVELLSYHNRMAWWFQNFGTKQLFENGRLNLPMDSILTSITIDTANFADWQDALYTPQLCAKPVIGKCYEPRHLLVFYNDHKQIFGCIEICISCVGGYTSQGLRNVVFCPSRRAVLSRLINETLIN